MTKPTILVIGSTGKTGSRIATQLTRLGYPVRHGSRRASTPFDWADPQTWTAALAGVQAVYVSYYPDLATPGAEQQVAALTAAAVAAGVERMVLLSGRGEHHARRCEQIVRDSGLAYTLVRAAWFAQNFSEGHLREPALAGMIALPAGDVREPIVDVDDIADVAVAALTGPGHDGELYEVTGPRLVGFDEMASALSAAIAAPVRYVPITLEAFDAEMLAAAGPLVADVVTAVCRETLDGSNAWLGDGVQRALGRKPRDFVDFCRDAAAAGAWDRAA